MSSIDAALELAWSLVGRPPAPRSHDTPVVRRFVLGDPQTSAARLFELLASHELLGPDGWLAADAGLLVLGDYFDYADPRGRDAAGREGLAFLSWLAHHPPEQVTLLAGNHDLCRVMELAFETDDSFRHARALGDRIHAEEQAGREEAVALRQQFHRAHPRIPTPELARRDFAAFSVAQRALVQELLLARRLRLAAPVRLQSGERLLAVHAGISTRELELLGCAAERDVARLADRLNDWLDQAAEQVRSDWEAMRPAALELSPVHVSGTTGTEGGGLLYHRPAHPDRPGADAAWERRSDAPRRFDPRALPLGLVQLVGHTGHRKCVEELGEWVADSARATPWCSVRTLRSDGAQVSYRCGIHLPPSDEAALLMVDVSIDKAPLSEVKLLRLAEAKQGSLRDQSFRSTRS